MKKVLSIVICGALAACSTGFENEWEEPQNINEEIIYIDEDSNTKLIINESFDDSVEIKDEVIEINTAPRHMHVNNNAPKITRTKKIITTTTTTEDPCTKDVCEPVVTVTEEYINLDDNQVIDMPTPKTEVTVMKRKTPAHVMHHEVKPAIVVETPTVDNVAVDVVVEVAQDDVKLVSMQAENRQHANIASSYSPEVYQIITARAINRMLSDTSAIYDTGDKKKLYISDTKLLSSDLPYGSHAIKGTTKDIIKGSKTFDVVYNASDADFIIDATADWYVANSESVPALQYKLSLLDKNGLKVNQWVEIIRQVQD